MVNKLIWDVDRSDAALAAFKEDARAYLDAWEAQAARPLSPCPEGGSLTSEEREAIQGRDYGALYAMGVNPFLLWQFARSISVPEIEITELITSFRAVVEPHGYPDFHT
jgi:hypothetical protein